MYGMDRSQKALNSGHCQNHLSGAKVPDHLQMECADDQTFLKPTYGHGFD